MRRRVANTVPGTAAPSTAISPSVPATADAQVHLGSPLVAAASALSGEISVPDRNEEITPAAQVGGEKLPLDPAFESKDVAILKAEGALSYFKATYRG
ncbi:MAG: hypothetical protein U9Q81_08750 [Pseudomonadota bacterium]|nr:hypothetical protein [Pseudomonadota bacterium]